MKISPEIMVEVALQFGRRESRQKSHYLLDVYSEILAREEGICVGIQAIYYAEEVGIYAQSAANEIRYLRQDYMARHAV